MTARRPSRGPRGLASTPTILQMEAVECGAASLAMVLAHYGRWIPLEQLRVDCGVSRDGSNAAQLARAARRHGLEAKGRRHEIDSLRKDAPRPCILFWGFGHFVVFEGCRGGRYRLNDPAGGRRWVDEREFSKAFTGIALELAPGPEFERRGSRPSLLRGVSAWMRGNLTAAVFAVACGAIASVPAAIIPGLVATFIDGVVQGGTSSWAAWIVGGMLLMLALQLFVTLLQGVVLNRLVLRMFLAQSIRMAEQLLSLPMRFHQQRSVGDLVSRFTSNEQIAASLGNQILLGLANVVTATVYAAALIAMSPLIGAIAVGATVLMLAAIRLTNNRVLDRSTAMQREVGRQYGVLMGLLRSLPEIKATSREGEAFNQWAGYQTKGLNAQQSVAGTTSWLDALPTVASGLVVTVFVLCLGGWEVMQGRLGVGELVAMQMLAGLLLAPVTQLVMLARVLQTTQAQMARVLDVFEYPRDTDDPAPTRSAAEIGGRLGGAVELKEISFGFDRAVAPLIEGLTLSISPGTVVGVVGPAGSGKSTILNLLLGIERPWSGEILFDGAPRARIEPHVLADSVSGASGSVTAFAGTLRDNVSMWDPTIGDEQLVAALRDADCLELLDRPGGLDAPISEGGRNLSGGQRQRLEIARTLARNPSVVVLDGATSALDGQTEARVLTRIRARGATVLLVTGRRSSIEFVDEVAIVESGRLADRGTPAELAARSEWFAREFGAVA
ncbi:MAG: cysteine peptidase family C39 domain-containing protein [Phycisphaerales bacterium]|jgi:NHLM bacteriocin system ABC transporter peptidase/ATP-binding protein